MESIRRHVPCLCVMFVLAVGGCAPGSSEDKADKRPSGAEVADTAAKATRSGDPQDLTLYSTSQPADKAPDDQDDTESAPDEAAHDTNADDDPTPTQPAEQPSSMSPNHAADAGGVAQPPADADAGVPADATPE